MIPVLFKGNETNFNHNGIGLLKDTLSCEVSEARNGSFDLELVYPITGPHFKDLKNGNIVQAKPNDTDLPHNFRINEIDKTLYDKEVVVYGVSITNDLGGNMVKSLYLADVTPQVILNEMKNVLHYPTTFNFVSNITTVGTVNWELNNPLNLIVGEEGSLVDIFGGEVKRTNNTLFLYGRRGKDNVTTIRAGKNLDGFKMTESFQGKYTQILPYFKYEAEIPSDIPGDTEGATIRQEFTVFGSIVSSPYHGRYPVNAIKPIDFSQNEYVRELKTLEALNEVASEYFSDLYYEIDKPSVSINVDMIQLVDSEQYELYERLEKVELTDTVSVYVPEYDVDILVKINELKYDSLRERTIGIVASSSSSGRTSLMDEISGSYKQFTTKLVDDKIQSATSGIINQILTKKDGSNMYAGRATPPDNAKLGDIWFKDTGGGDVELYEFDGVNWVRKMYKGFGDDVRQLVDDKIAESNALFTGAIDEQAAVVKQVNALAQLAKTEAANAKAEAANAKASALAAITDAGQANELAQQAITDADTTRTELLGRVNTLDSKAKELNTKATSLQTQADSNTSQITQQAGQIASKVDKTEFNSEKTKITNLQTSITQQAQNILAQAQSQTALTNRVTTVETLADGTKTTVAELSKTVDKATGDITSVTNLTKVVEDSLDSVKTNYTQLSQTVNTQTGQIQTINSKTADLQSGIDGVTERFENLRTGQKNLILNSDKIPFKQPGANTTIVAEKDYFVLTSTGYTANSWGGVTWDLSINSIKVGEEFSLLLPVYLDSSVDNDAGLSLIIKNHPLNLATFMQTISGKTDKWFNLAVTFKATRDLVLGSKPLYLCFTKNGKMRFKKPILVSGNVIPSDWSPADEDTAQQIAEYKRTADQNYAGLQSTVSTLDGKVTQNKTAIDQTSREIALKANQTELNTLTGRMSTAESSITQQAGQIALKADKTYVDTVKQTVDSHTTSITQQASQIALKANQTDYNNLTGRMSTAESSITQNATEISKRLTSTQVNQAIFSDKRIKDTRNDNQSPQWYWTNYPFQTVEEFKGSSVIGLTSESTFALLTTNVHWENSSCGKVKQTVKTDTATYERYGTDASWGPWVKIANSSDLANYTTKTEFQTVKETTNLYERVIGSTEVNVKDNIARIVMTDSSFVTEVAKFGEHNNNLIVDAVSHAQTIAIGGASIVRYPLQNRIDFSRSGATTNVDAGISCKLHVSRFITGEKYTLSFDYYLHSAPDSNLLFELKDGGTTLGGGDYFASPTTPTGAWRKHTVTFVSINSSTPDSNNIRLLLYSIKNSSVAIKNIMLVRGDKIGTFSPSQVDVVSTRVEQTANSYSIKFLNGANDITTQLNLTNSGARIKSSLIHLDGNVTVSGTAWMDGAIIKNLSADKITTGTLNANNVNITNLSVNSVSGITATYLQSVIGTAFIDWMKGKVIQSYNNNMTIDLMGGNITLNSGSNAIKRVKGTHTAFVHFNDVTGSYDGNVGSLYAAIGVTSSGDGVNSSSSGRFAGLRAFRAASGTGHDATIDQTEIYGDKIIFKDDFSVQRAFLIRPVNLDKQYDLNDDVLNPIRFFVKLLIHLNNVGWNWQNSAFLDALLNDWNAYGMSRYGKFRDNTIYYP